MDSCEDYLLVVSIICVIFSLIIGVKIGRFFEKRSIDRESIERESLERESANHGRKKRFRNFRNFSGEFSLSGCTPNNPCRCCKNVKVYFLPDSSAPCPSYVNKIIQSGDQRCSQANWCPYLHGFSNEPESALMEIMATMAQAKKSIYVCVYLVTLSQIRDILIALRRNKGILVLMITDSTDNEELKIDNQTEKLKEAGIQVKTNETAKMHNKFVIVDKQIAILGSTNWTKKAFLSNDEALIKTRQPVIVEAFTRKFYSMWGEMSDYKRPDVRLNMDTTNQQQQQQQRR